MLLLFIFIGILAIGLPLMLMFFGESPAPPESPAKTATAITQPVTMPAAESGQTGSGAATPLDEIAPDTFAATSAPPSQASGISIPGLPIGVNLPSQADIAKELKRVMPESSKMPSQAELIAQLQRLLPEGAQMPSEAELMKQVQIQMAAGQFPSQAEFVRQLQQLLPEGSKLPSQAELTKQLQLVNEKIQVGR